MNKNGIELEIWVSAGTRNGFSILELVVSMFLLALVIAGVLLLMAANLSIIQRANERMIATALAMYQIESVKNIDFPPVYYDIQNRFGESTIYQPDPGTGRLDFTPREFQEKFKVERYVIAYATDGTQVNTSLPDYYDRAMLMEIPVYVIRKRDNRVILKTTTLISRNGLY